MEAWQFFMCIAPATIALIIIAGELKKGGLMPSFIFTRT